MILISGCSVFKHASERETRLRKDVNKIFLLDNVERQNISKSGFYIQKAEIEFTSGETRQKLLAVIKFEFPGKYLISIKNKSGIEAIRVLLTSDTVLVNDRLNKIVYYGRPVDLKKKYGIPFDFIPFIFGDFMSDNENDISSSNCINGQSEVTGSMKGIKINYVLDCSLEKSIAASLEDSFEKRIVEFKYKNFIEVNSKIIPEYINVIDNQKKLEIVIKVLKTEIPWIGKIEFFPGSGYEILPLL